MSTNGSFNKVIYFTIKSPVAVKRLVDLLIKSPNDSLLLPFIDYPGPLSKEILSRKFASLSVCERNNDIKEPFHAYVREKFQNKRIHVYPYDLFDLSFKKYCSEAQETCSNIVKTASTGDCDRQIKFLVPLLKSKYESGFLKNLYYQNALRIGLSSNTLLHYYFLMSERQYNYLNAKPTVNLNQYRSSTVLYNTLFNIQKLESFDLKSCFDITLKKIQSTSDSKSSLYKKVHVILLKPRVEIINSLSPRSFLEYRFLVTQIMHRRSSLVLPLLEKWFYNCSKDVIDLGIHDKTKSGDLTQDEYYNLYLHLKSRPGYENSTFVQAAASIEETLITN